MNEKYRRLCAADRKVICNMNQAGAGQAEIGLAIMTFISFVFLELYVLKSMKSLPYSGAFRSFIT